MMAESPINSNIHNDAFVRLKTEIENLKVWRKTNYPKARFSQTYVMIHNITMKPPMPF